MQSQAEGGIDGGIGVAGPGGIAEETAGEGSKSGKVRHGAPEGKEDRDGSRPPLST